MKNELLDKGIILPSGGIGKNMPHRRPHGSMKRSYLNGLSVRWLRRSVSKKYFMTHWKRNKGREKLQKPAGIVKFLRVLELVG